jgi:hypothetical protein
MTFSICSSAPEGFFSTELFAHWVKPVAASYPSVDPRETWAIGQTGGPAGETVLSHTVKEGEGGLPYHMMGERSLDNPQHLVVVGRQLQIVGRPGAQATNYIIRRPEAAHHDHGDVQLGPLYGADHPLGA